MLCISDGRQSIKYYRIGGGARNAYSVGVLNGIWKNLHPLNRSYDVVSGTSMAALNAFIIAMTNPGEEREASELLTFIWEHLDNSKIYQSWTWGYLQGLFYKSGLYNTEPFTKTLESIKLLRAYKRRFAIGMIDINEGALVTVQESIEPQRMLKYIKAASATPGFFPPISEGNSLLVDGSSVISVDITQTIERCREIASNDEDITLDLIMVNQCSLDN